MKVLAIAASNSSTSINRRFVTYAAHLINGAQVTIPDLNDYEMDVYSSDREKKNQIPKQAFEFKQLLKEADYVVISFAEHNGSYSAAFKNIMDWISRIPGDTWESKPFFLMATSPGRRGGKTVLTAAVHTFAHMGALVKAQFSLPSFHQNFDDEIGITDVELHKEFMIEMNKFVAV